MATLESLQNIFIPVPILHHTLRAYLNQIPDQTSVADRRQYKRLPVSFRANLLAESAVRSDNRVTDISMGGSQSRRRQPCLGDVYRAGHQTGFRQRAHKDRDGHGVFFPSGIDGHSVPRNGGGRQEPPQSGDPQLAGGTKRQPTAFLVRISRYAKLVFVEC